MFRNLFVSESNRYRSLRTPEAKQAVMATADGLTALCEELLTLDDAIWFRSKEILKLVVGYKGRQVLRAGYYTIENAKNIPLAKLAQFKEFINDSFSKIKIGNIEPQEEKNNDTDSRATLSIDPEDQCFIQQHQMKSLQNSLEVATLLIQEENALHRNQLENIDTRINECFLAYQDKQAKLQRQIAALNIHQQAEENQFNNLFTEVNAGYYLALMSLSLNDPRRDYVNQSYQYQYTIIESHRIMMQNQYQNQIKIFNLLLHQSDDHFKESIASLENEKINHIHSHNEKILFFEDKRQYFSQQLIELQAMQDTSQPDYFPHQQGQSNARTHLFSRSSPVADFQIAPTLDDQGQNFTL